jgi:predicted RNase H-like nuclease (RuvC/YqgF family)
MDNMDNIYTLIITVVSVLSGTTIWRFFERRSIKKERDDEFIKMDCKDRITKLEALLEASAREKDEMRNLILKLTAEVAELRVKVEFLTEENEFLAKRNKKLNLNG